MGIRPENIYEDEVHISSMPHSLVKVKVDITEMMGAETYLYLKLEGSPIIARVNRRTTAQADEEITIAIDANKVHLFDKDTEAAILH